MAVKDGGGAGVRMVATLFLIHNIQGASRLSEFVSHYEGLAYSSRDTHHQHLRLKRSALEDRGALELQFVALGREFVLLLQPDHSLFHKDYHAEGPGGVSLSHLDHTHYHGTVRGDPASYVYGSVRNGVFDGQIHTGRDGTFYVERVQRYGHLLDSDGNSAPAFQHRRDLNNNTTTSSHSDITSSSIHSVIYHDSHVNLPVKGGCAVDADVRAWMEGIQNSAGASGSVPAAAAPKADQAAADDSATPQTADPATDPSPEYKYTAAANRVKRALKPPSNRKSCSLFIITDPLLWRHVWSQERLEGKSREETDAKTQEEILSLIAQHVKAVNKIYGDTEFSAGKYRHAGHTFEVQRIKIYNDSDCTGWPRNETNPFCISNIDVSNFLNLHSKENHEHFCLSYVFTYRDFTGGTLGLAWVASASGASGGICEKYKTYTENINGVHHTAKRSLNTGIITFVNYNARVPPKVSQLTLAHEIGHNFGSPHDYPAECRPGGSKGNFIMFASATSGDRENNNKFSGCSIQNISAVLDAVAEDRKTNCFEESDGAFCGNKIVEEGEECDCGFDENECTEKCCHPRMNSSLSEEENKQNRCKRRQGVQCSPSEGPCCSNNCKFVSLREGQQCQAVQDCTEAAYCNGNQATCPKPVNRKDNETECNEGTKVCQAGECKGSICLKFGMDQCFLSSSDTRVHHSTRDLCELACQSRGTNRTCMSTGDWAATGTIPGLTAGLTLRPGAPCDNFQGYCDVFLKCRQVDAEGPLARLKNLLFNQKTLLTIAEWVTTYWYAVLLMGIGFVIFMALFIKCFAAHTPSSNPKLPKNKHITETLRHPMNTLRRKRYQQAPGSAGSSTSGPPPRSGPSGSGQSSSAAPPPSRGAPPPYPGMPQGGPGHGYGEGRGHYNRSRGGGGPEGGRGGGGPVGGSGGQDRRSWAPQQQASANRLSRIEMSPLSR